MDADGSWSWHSILGTGLAVGGVVLTAVALATGTGEAVIIIGVVIGGVSLGNDYWARRDGTETQGQFAANAAFDAVTALPFGEAFGETGKLAWGMVAHQAAVAQMGYNVYQGAAEKGPRPKLLECHKNSFGKRYRGRERRRHGKAKRHGRRR